MSLLATLVDELLTTPSPDRGAGPPNPARPSRPQPSAVEQTPKRRTTTQIPESGPDYRLPGIEPPATPERTPQTPHHYPSGMLDEPLDPEALAEMINDILIEQARRHGVDLS